MSISHDQLQTVPQFKMLTKVEHGSCRDEGHEENSRGER